MSRAFGPILASQTNMQIVDARIERYLKDTYDDGDPVRAEMESFARKKGFPIVGPLVGRTLTVLARAVGARRVFELGSGYGYSALHFARAVGPEGVVHCTDLSEANAKLAESLLSRAGVWSRVVYHCEEAIGALRRIGGSWDVVFNDIDKESYPETIDLAYERLRPGGLFITDNVLWSGRVLGGKARDRSPSTDGVVEFTKMLFSHPGFVTTVDPTRDGLAVAVRV